MCALELDSLQVRRDEKSSLQMDLETASFLKISHELRNEIVEELMLI